MPDSRQDLQKMSEKIAGASPGRWKLHTDGAYTRLQLGTPNDRVTVSRPNAEFLIAAKQQWPLTVQALSNVLDLCNDFDMISVADIRKAIQEGLHSGQW